VSLINNREILSCMQRKTIWIINQYASTPQTGMGGRHYYLARELAKQGHNVYLVAASYTHLLREPRSIDKPYEVEKIEGFNFVWVKMPRYENAHDKQRTINWFWFAWKLRGLRGIIADKPDAILYSSPSLVGFLGAKHLANKYPKARFVFDVRDIWPLTLVLLGGYSVKHPFIRFLQWIEDKACKTSDHVISNWPYAVEHMVKHGLRRDNFTWLPNGFLFEEFDSQEPLPQKLVKRIPKGKFIVGYTGTLGKANALDVLLDTAEVMREVGDVAFVIVGGGKEESELTQEIAARGLDNVYYLGSIPKIQVPSMLSNFDACYVGFRKNPLYLFGSSLNKLPEYFASKKPIIYSIDSPFKPVDDASAGITVQAENPEGIAAAIMSIKGMSSDERRILGENGFSYALEHYEYGKLGKKLAKILVDDD